jgi:methionyl-tRNA synthetase
MKKYYITTPLYYVNYKPHIGHAYTTLAADVLSRFLKSKGIAVYFQTGTDEHGSNIEKTARQFNKEPKQWADEIMSEFKNLWKTLHIEYDYFIRTTDKNHEEQVQNIFEKMIENGDIYLGYYEGLYCQSCENYLDESELIDGKCPIHKKEVEKIKEETYFFKLSKYEKPLLEYYKKNPEFLSPSYRAGEIINFVQSGLKDISVSRTKVAWGIQVKSNPKHTIYVWFDALINYITGPGYRTDGSSSQFNEVWPCDVHLVGKEIFRFHAIIWPAILMSIGVKLPKKVYAHGWWTVEGEKMSKSKGNIINPQDIVQEYGLDAFRYFIFREVPFGQDGDFSLNAFKTRYNSELANDLGNLFSRTINMINKYLNSSMPDKPYNSQTFSQLYSSQTEIEKDMYSLQFSSALDKIWKNISILNKKIDTEKPWEMAKTDKEKVKFFLYEMVWSLRLIASWIYPFMPDTSTKMQMYLSVGQIGDSKKVEPLFPRKL